MRCSIAPPDLRMGAHTLHTRPSAIGGYKIASITPPIRNGKCLHSVPTSGEEHVHALGD
jgi:hypothetical protein